MGDRNLERAYLVTNSRYLSYSDLVYYHDSCWSTGLSPIDGVVLGNNGDRQFVEFTVVSRLSSISYSSRMATTKATATFTATATYTTVTATAISNRLLYGWCRLPIAASFSNRT